MHVFFSSKTIAENVNESFSPIIMSFCSFANVSNGEKCISMNFSESFEQKT